MSTKFTPGPWQWTVTPSGEVRLETPDRGHLYVMGFARKGMRGSQPRFSIWGDGPRGRRGGIMYDFVESGAGNHPDARLIAAAPDHALIARAMCIGAGRWEPWGDGRGEFCINGLRHATKLDEFGIPVVTSMLREALAVFA